MNKEEIGKFIKQLREEKGLTQEELAQKIYCSRSTLAHIESGRIFPSHDKIISLAKILGVNEMEIYSAKKIKSDEEFSQASYKILRYFDKKYKRVIMFLIFLIILSLLFLFGIYFFNSYKSIKMYRIDGNSDNYIVDSGILLISKQKLILDFKVENKSDSIIKKVALKYKTKEKESLVIETDSDSLYVVDFYKYNAYLDYYDIIKNKGYFYLEISTSENTETLNLSLKEEFVNDAITSKNNQSISNEKNNEESSSIIPENIKKLFSLEENGIYTYKYKVDNIDYSLSYDVDSNIFNVLEGDASYTKSWIYYLDVKNLVYSYSKDSKIMKELDFEISSMNEEESEIYDEFKNNYLDKYLK